MYAREVRVITDGTIKVIIIGGTYSDKYLWDIYNETYE